LSEKPNAFLEMKSQSKNVWAFILIERKEEEEEEQKED
jgi:hypothetical protein